MSRKEEEKKLLIDEALYLDLEDLKETQSDEGNKGEKMSPTPFIKSLSGESIRPTPNRI